LEDRGEETKYLLSNFPFDIVPSAEDIDAIFNCMK
jgi:hypothetical protein